MKAGRTYAEVAGVREDHRARTARMLSGTEVGMSLDRPGTPGSSQTVQATSQKNW